MSSYMSVLLASAAFIIGGAFFYENRETRAELADLQADVEELRDDLNGHVTVSLYYKQTFDMLRDQFERAARSQIAKQMEDAK